MNLNKGTYPKLYNSWRGMRERCLNPNHKSYVWYGGKGIKVEESWKKFKVFATWALANGYTDGLSIDRVKSDKDYIPTNCKWITPVANTIDGNSHRYRAEYEQAFHHWKATYCTGVELAAMVNKSFSVTCGWIRGWKANNNQLVSPGAVTAAR